MTKEQLKELIDAITYEAGKGYSIYDVHSKLEEIDKKLGQTNNLLEKLLKQ